MHSWWRSSGLEVLLCGGSDGSLPAGLDVLLGDLQACQVGLDLGKEKEISWGQVGTVGRVLQHLEVVIGDYSVVPG